MATSPAGTGPDRGELTPEQRNLTRVDRSGAGKDLLMVAKQAETLNTAFMSALRATWERNIRATRSQHATGSKYGLKAYAGRSKLFRPKTRAALRAALATSAAALFATDDAVTVSAELEGSEEDMAAAAVIQELLNYRLDRTSPRGGMPWFMIAMGSVHNAMTTGAVVSKQYWDYETKERERPFQTIALDESGVPIIGMDGKPMLVSETRREIVPTVDRPMIDLIPTEHVMPDLAAPWFAPAQLGAFFVVRYPVLRGDLLRRINTPAKEGPGGASAIEWLPVEDGVLNRVQADYDAQGVRIAREGGQDARQERAAMTGDHSIVWINENCFRYGGEDYHFWSIGTDVYLSMPIPMGDAYPHLDGDRPYTMGVGAIEPHVVFPQSPVESWQPLQLEANDVVNLRLDSLKQAIEPIAKVKIGSLIDPTQLQPGRRGAPGAIVQVRNQDDLEFAQWPGPSGQAYAEMNNLNADFDELAGTFSGSSVQTNRQLNETVGGMRMLNVAAGSVREFDLRVWVETWCQPTLYQVVRLEQFYESNGIVLAVAGAKAAMMKRFGVSQIDDEALTREVRVRCNIGLGASDPMEKLAKMNTSLTMIGSLVPFFDKQVEINAEAMVKEIMGLAGYKDPERLFVFSDKQGAGDGEQEAAAQMAIEELRAKTEMQLAQMNNASAEERERMKAMMSLIETIMKINADRAAQRQAAAQAERSGKMQAASKLMLQRSANAQRQQSRE